MRACDGAALRRFNGGVGGFGELSGRFRGSFGEASVMRWEGFRGASTRRRGASGRLQGWRRGGVGAESGRLRGYFEGFGEASGMLRQDFVGGIPSASGRIWGGCVEAS